jgi:hypothetical protein
MDEAPGRLPMSLHLGEMSHYREEMSPYPGDMSPCREDISSHIEEMSPHRREDGRVVRSASPNFLASRRLSPFSLGGNKRGGWLAS